MSAPLRTLAEVETELTMTGALLRHHRSRQGATVTTREMLAGEPAEDVGRLDGPLEVWAMLARTPVT